MTKQPSVKEPATNLRGKSSRRQYDAFRQAFREGRESAFTRDEAEDEELAGAPDDVGKRRYLRAYVEWLWPHRFETAAILILSLAVAGLEMVQPLFMRFIIDRVLLADSISKAQQLQGLNWAGAAFLLVVTVGQLIGAYKNYRQKKLNVSVIQSLRRSMFDRLLKLPLKKLSDMKTGGIVSRLSGDINTTMGLLQMAIISPGVSIIRLIVALGILFYLNWRLSLTAMSIIPGIVLISFSVSKKIRPIYRAMRRDNSISDSRVSETFGGIRIVRAFQREPRENADYNVGRHTILRKELFAHRREIVLWTTWGFLIACVNVVILWYGGYLCVRGEATVGDIMAFQWFTLLLLNPIWQIVNSYSELQRSMAAMERVFEVLAMDEDKPDREDAIAAPREVNELRFDNVTFEYEPGRPAVANFEVTVPGGSTVALVGKSGAGKTTVTDLVARFYDPTHGRILLNGIDIREFRLASYRDLLAVVQQETFLFDGTIRDNIAYGRRDATLDEIVDAGRRSNSHEFIVELPHGYDSLVGERGVKLSGGQCQRISIARAILADPQILVLDEATSNLDTESEQLIQQSMAELLRGRTTFVIAHRLSTVTSADWILVLEKGRIVEQGSHESLMAARSTYYEMVTRQREAMLESNESFL